jgi:hypothetical protein
MISKAKPQFTPKISYSERAAICAWCAERTASAEAEAALLYLQQMWILAAKVAEIIEGNGSISPLHSQPHVLSF